MNGFQKTVKYGAIILAIFLIIAIIGAIMGALGVFGMFLDGDSKVSEDLKKYTMESNITDLEIEIGAAEFMIKEGDSFFVESNIENITVKENGGTLKITEKSRLFNLKLKDAVLILYIPKGTVFKTVDITTGAGKLTSDALSADRVSFELGAGEVNIKELNAALKAEIEGGAGAVTIGGGTLYNLDLKMGVGELKLTSALKGDCDLECGVGSVTVNLLGHKDEYSISVDKGIGTAKLDGQTMHGGTVYGNGINKIDADGGVGEINIRFED